MATPVGPEPIYRNLWTQGMFPKVNCCVCANIVEEPTRATFHGWMDYFNEYYTEDQYFGKFKLDSEFPSILFERLKELDWVYYVYDDFYDDYALPEGYYPKLPFPQDDPVFQQYYLEHTVFGIVDLSWISMYRVYSPYVFEAHTSYSSPVYQLSWRFHDGNTRNFQIPDESARQKFFSVLTGAGDNPRGYLIHEACFEILHGYLKLNNLEHKLASLFYQVESDFGGRSNDIPIFSSNAGNEKKFEFKWAYTKPSLDTFPWQQFVHSSATDNLMPKNASSKIDTQPSPCLIQHYMGLELVAAFLELKDIASGIRVCKSWNIGFESETSWQSLVGSCVDMKIQSFVPWIPKYSQGIPNFSVKQMLKYIVTTPEEQMADGVRNHIRIYRISKYQYDRKVRNTKFRLEQEREEREEMEERKKQREKQRESERERESVCV